MRLLKIMLTLSLLLLATIQPAVAEEKDWSLGSLSSEIRTLTERVSPAVVQIYTTSFGPVMGSIPQGAAVFGHQQATGSGVILDSSGYIITNSHVVQGAKRIQVRLSAAAMGQDAGMSIVAGGGALMGAKVIGIDKETDLAVIKIEGTNLP